MIFEELFNWLQSNKLHPVKVNEQIITFSQGEATFGAITEQISYQDEIPARSGYTLQYRTTLRHLPLHFTKSLSHDNLMVELEKFINLPKKD